MRQVGRGRAIATKTSYTAGQSRSSKFKTLALHHLVVWKFISFQFTLYAFRSPGRNNARYQLCFGLTNYLVASSVNDKKRSSPKTNGNGDISITQLQHSSNIAEMLLIVAHTCFTTKNIGYRMLKRTKRKSVFMYILFVA